MNNSNKAGLFVIFLIAFVAAVSLGTYGIYQYYNLKRVNNLSASSKEAIPENTAEKNNQDLSEEKPVCPEGWEQYKQDIIGISFCYPKEWGAPSISPIKNLTRLANMEEDFKTQNIYYENALDIVFDKNSEMHIKLFNDQYSGKSQRGIDEPHVYYESGSTGDVLNLKNSGDICDYQIGYDYRYNPEMQLDTLKTIYTSCSSRVKTVLTQNKEIFDFGGYGTLYTYDLRLLSFKKLTNGFFENVIVSRKIDEAHQIHENLATLDEFFNAKKTTNVQDGLPIKNKDQFDLETKEFRQFINSIAVFKPVPKIPDRFKEIFGEDPNVTSIRKYYWLLGSSRLIEAYEMRSAIDDVSFEKFQEWYRSVYFAEASHFEERAANQYRFRVDYQDDNNLPEVYRVEMKVVDGKLETISSEKMIGEKAVYGNMEAFAKQEAEYNYIVLAKDGKEIVVDKAEELNKEYSNIGAALYFNNPEFSSRGSYLAYRASGWEWAFARLYDIKNKSVISKIFSPSSYGFTEDEKYFYDCEANAMGGEFHGRVYNVPGFKVKYELPFE